MVFSPSHLAASSRCSPSTSTKRLPSSLRTWIDRCAVRVAYAHFARKRRSPALQPVAEIDAEDPTADDRTSMREAVRRLYTELDRLKPRQRIAFTQTRRRRVLHLADPLHPAVA